ncbi:MAG: DUF4412 domain-containing protein [Deltaproteobacteria bacterium]|nr:DUF4412 domain-containing protein [Deltaproteobacteria bacterium]MBW1938971.1 DUF4412 domain-containing protein [Deltaproteobacteria bacterium]
MKEWKRIAYLPLALLIFFTISTSAYGDLYWESEMVSGGVPAGFPSNLPKQMIDQFNKTETIKHYLTPYAYRTDTNDSIMIIKHDTMTMYHINVKDKTYTKINMTTFLDNESGKEMAEEMKVTPTNETKKIVGYMCKKYNMTVMGGNNEFWISKDVKGYKEYTAFGKKMEKMFEKNPMLRKLGMAGKWDGFPVQTVMKVMGITSTTTLKTIEGKALSKDLFEIPKGYKMLDLKVPHH